MRFLEVNDLLSEKKFAILLWKKSWPHVFTFWIQISRKLAALKWVKRCVVLVTNSSENAAFLPPFCARLAEGPKVCRERTGLNRRLRVKFRPNRFRFAWVISEKWLSCDRNICLWHIKLIRKLEQHCSCCCGIRLCRLRYVATGQSRGRSRGQLARCARRHCMSVLLNRFIGQSTLSDQLSVPWQTPQPGPRSPINDRPLTTGQCTRWLTDGRDPQFTSHSSCLIFS